MQGEKSASPHHDAGAGRLSRFFDRVLNVGALVAAILLVAIMLATVVKVAMRALLGHGILGIDQLAGMGLVYLTFLGAPLVLCREQHVSLNLLIGEARSKRNRILVFANSLIGAVTCFIGAFFGALVVLHSVQRGIVVAAELEIPRAVGLVPIPIGCFLLGVEFLRRARRVYRSEPEPASNSTQTGA